MSEGFFKKGVLRRRLRAAQARTFAEVGALVENIDQVIALEDRPTPLGSDNAFHDEVASLSGYPRPVSLPSVSLVIPTLNEEANIGRVLKWVPELVDEV